MLRICGLLFAASSCCGNSRIFWQWPWWSQVELKGNLFQPLLGEEEVPGGCLFGLGIERLQHWFDRNRKCIVLPYHASSASQPSSNPRLSLWFSNRSKKCDMSGWSISQSHSNSHKLTFPVLGEETCELFSSITSCPINQPDLWQGPAPPFARPPPKLGEPVYISELFPPRCWFTALGKGGLFSSHAPLARGSPQLFQRAQRDGQQQDGGEGPSAQQHLLFLLLPACTFPKCCFNWHKGERRRREGGRSGASQRGSAPHFHVSGVSFFFSFRSCSLSVTPSPLLPSLLL